VRNIIEGSNCGIEVPLIFVHNKADLLEGPSVEAKMEFANKKFRSLLSNISGKAAGMKDKLYVTSTLNVTKHDRCDFEEVALMRRVRELTKTRTER